MSNVLIISGAKPFLISKGELSIMFATLAAEHLAALGYSLLSAHQRNIRPRSFSTAAIDLRRNCRHERARRSSQRMR